MDIKNSLKRNVRAFNIKYNQYCRAFASKGFSLMSEKRDFHLSYLWMIE